MSIKRFILLIISHVPTLIWAQASYMYEAQEDSGNPITGLFGLILLGGLLYFILHIKELYDKQQETIKRNKIEFELEAKINRERVKWEEEQRKATKPIAVDLGLSVLWAKYNLAKYFYFTGNYDANIEKDENKAVLLLKETAAKNHIESLLEQVSTVMSFK